MSAVLKTKSSERQALLAEQWHTASEVLVMKVRSSVRRICENCKIIRRRGVVRVICTNPRHKQRQG